MKLAIVAPIMLSVCLCSICGVARPLGDDVDILLVLPDPYGANTHLLQNQFEDHGWRVTIAGLTDVVRTCGALCRPMATDVLIPDVDVSEYDAVVIAPTRGAFHFEPEPGDELRQSAETTALLREADRLGLTLFSGCAGTLVLADAGILDGRTVLRHPRVDLSCEERGITCIESGLTPTLPPLVDGNVVTATNLRLYQVEVAEAIQRSLYRDVAPGPLQWSSIDLVPTPVDSDGALVSVLCLGGPHSDFARAVCRVEDGYVVVGSTYSIDSGGPDALVVCLDDDLAVRWARTYGGPGWEDGNDVCLLSDGSVAVVGTTSSAGDAEGDAFALKISRAGELLWSTVLEDRDVCAGLGVCATSDGGLAVCGFSQLGEDPATSNSDVYVARLSGNGEPVWTKTYGASSHERGVSIAALENGGFAIAGGSTSPDGYGNYDLALTQLDEDGEVLSETYYGFSNYDFAEDVIATRDGGFALAGFGDAFSEIMDTRVWLTDASGKGRAPLLLGERLSLDYARAIVERPDGGFLIAGRTNTTTQERNDAWLLTMSAEAKSTWEQAFAGDGADGFRGLCDISDGKTLAVGYTTSYGRGSYDMLLALVDVAATP